MLYLSTERNDTGGKHIVVRRSSTNQEVAAFPNLAEADKHVMANGGYTAARASERRHQVAGWEDFRWKRDNTTWPKGYPENPRDVTVRGNPRRP